MIGSAFNDVIIGTANFWGNVFHGAGNDTLIGGNGNDTFVFRSGDGSDIVTDFATSGGNSFNDVIRLVGWGGGV